MRKTNFTILSVVLLLMSALGLQGQECPLSCNDLVNISLDDMCERDVVAADVLNISAADLAACSGQLEVEIAYPYPAFYQYLSPNMLDGSLIGYKLVYKVIDTANQNSCWGYIQVEDKFPPQIDCEDDTIHCWQAEVFGAVLIDGDTTGRDNCEYPARTQELSRVWVDFECDSAMFVGKIIRDVIAFDVWGNTKECMGQTLYILRDSINQVVCPGTDTTFSIECCQDEYRPYSATGNNKDDLWESQLVWYDDEGYAHPNVIIGFNGKSTTSLGMVEPPYIDYNGYIGHLGADVAIVGGAIAEESPVDNGKCNVIGHYKDHIIPTCGSEEDPNGPDWIWTYKIRREWKIFDWCTGEDTTCIQWIKIVDTLGPQLDTAKWEEDGDRYQEAYVKAHDCKAHVELTPPPILEECGMKWVKNDAERLEQVYEKITAHYELTYEDKKHPGKLSVETGSMGVHDTEIVYLPEGWFEIKWVIRDPCWNETHTYSYVAVYDQTPPTPVCDEITQVTLDPVNCWARVYAEDLDDGSDDNCKHKLHFAVAHKDSIEMYREKLHDDIVACKGHYEYEDNKEYYDRLIEEWINCFVFQDYIDLSECGTDMVALRVYEADGMPIYDPHIFKGTKHQWFCFNVYDQYACYFKIHYDEFASYEHPKADICRDYIKTPFCDCTAEGSGTISLENYPDFVGDCADMDTYGKIVESGTCIVDYGCEDRPYIGGPYFPNYGVDGGKPYKNEVCCWYQSADAASSTSPWNAYYLKWQSLQAEYPELPHICEKRYWFPHLYNDCWIEIIKDDGNWIEPAI